MAKNLALLALILGIASLFLPTVQGLGGAITVGVLAGTVRKVAGVYLMAPSTFAALFGVTLGRVYFTHGLGALHLFFGVVGLLMCSLIFGDERVQSGQANVGLGTYFAAAAGVLVVLAGLIGLIRPNPPR